MLGTPASTQTSGGFRMETSPSGGVLSAPKEVWCAPTRLLDCAAPGPSGDDAGGLLEPLVCLRARSMLYLPTCQLTCHNLSVDMLPAGAGVLSREQAAAWLVLTGNAGCLFRDHLSTRPPAQLVLPGHPPLINTQDVPPFFRGTARAVHLERAGLHHQDGFWRCPLRSSHSKRAFIARRPPLIRLGRSML